MALELYGSALSHGEDVAEFLQKHERKELLRFITCGSVDDGKSTLIGRLLYDSRMIFDDHLASLETDSRRHGTQGEDIDFALLVDGLSAEREQGITIDVAYRYFTTDKRKFIVADSPGHEQFTRNMVTAASTADLAVVLVDATKGILPQTRRHSYIARLLGIRKLVLAVNKMDLVGYSKERYDDLVEEYRSFADPMGPAEFLPIPMSGLKGDNITSRSQAMPWYRGPALIEHLDIVEFAPPAADQDSFRMPVQWVNRRSDEFRGFCGTVASGMIKKGQKVRLLPSGRSSCVDRIVTMDGDLDAAIAGQSITLTLEDQVDCSRGDLVTTAEAPAEVADQFEATLVWLNEAEMMPGRSYLLKIGAATVGASITEAKYQVNVNSLEHMPAKTLELNAIGVVNLALDRPVPFTPYDENKQLGGFILIDRLTNDTLAAGMIHFALRRAHNIHWQHIEVTPQSRAAMKRQVPRVLWLTGLSGSGKSTIANLVEKKLHAMGRHTFLLDGDNVRHGLNRDLGFTEADRVENMRRVGHVARLMADAGLIVLCAFISPFRSERQLVRDVIGADIYVEIHVDALLEDAERRDPKGLYRKARSGELTNFTGIDSPYEPPEDPAIRIDTSAVSAEDAADRIVAYLFP